MASIWDINPFDQWGVELGKVMAHDTLNELKKADKCKRFDDSTNNLIDIVNCLKEGKE